MAIIHIDDEYCYPYRKKMNLLRLTSLFIAHNTAPKVLDEWFFVIWPTACSHQCALSTYEFVSIRLVIHVVLFSRKCKRLDFNPRKLTGFVRIFVCHTELSRKCQLEIGVPQGSIVGPILFVLCVNDINGHVHLGACNLYADDTLVYCSANYMDKLQENTQKCVSSISEWYYNNQLIIITLKSNTMANTTVTIVLFIGL